MMTTCRNSSTAVAFRATGKLAENAVNGVETGPSETLSAMNVVESSVPGEDLEALTCQEVLLALQAGGSDAQYLTNLQ